MALFRRDEPEPAKRPVPGTSARPPRPEPEAAVSTTVIAPGSRLVGTITGGTEVLVEGFFEGRAEVDGTFVVGPHGRVQGDVKARVIRIAGNVHGNIEATERAELTPSGRIEGDVLAPRVAIAEGGFCQGRIEMTRAREAAAGGGTATARAAASDAALPRQTALEGARSDG